MKYLKLLSMLVVLLLASSCHEENVNNLPDPGFSAYISSYSSGYISADAPLVIRLAELTGKKIEDGMAADKSLFSLKPAIKGKVYWMDEQTLKFLPDEPWPGDTEIEVEFFLHKVIEVDKLFKVFRFTVRTLPLSFSVGSTSLEPLDQYNYTWNRLLGTLQFSDAFNMEKLNKVLEATIDGKQIALKFEPTDKNLVMSFVADSIQRLGKPQELLLSWNGKALGSKISGTESIVIKAIDDFSIQSVKVFSQPDQRIEITFSDPVSNDQLLDGLVYLDNESNVTIQREKNKVILYPAKALSGQYQLIVAEGVANSAGHILKESYTESLSFSLPLPGVKFAGDGIFLTGNHNNQLHFQAIGLLAVDVQVVRIFENNMHQFLQWNNLDGSSDIKRVGKPIAAERIELDPTPGKSASWKNYSIDLTRLIGNNTGTVYRIYLSFQKDYAVTDCQDNSPGRNNHYQTKNKLEEILDKWNSDLYYNPDYYYPEGFSWEERDNPCSDSYYYGDRFVSHNVLVSDIGIIAKETDPVKNEYAFYVNNLLTTNSMKGVSVRVFDFQQQLIVEGKTDDQGEVRLSMGKNVPFLVTATDGKHSSFLKIDKGSALNLSRFDVSGQEAKTGMKGFAYTERGVYRPGDTIFIGFMLQSLSLAIPQNYPVVCELFNSRQQLVASQTSLNQHNGLFTFRLPTLPEAPTGLWNARITAGAAVFEKRVRVETIKPNRLKVQFNFGSNTMTKNDRNRKASIQVNWLHGSKAENVETTLSLSVAQDVVQFSKYKGFSFSDATKYFYHEQSIIAQGKTDQNGLFNFDLETQSYRYARGRLKLQFTAKAMETGGDITTAMHTITYDPFDTYVGIRVPEYGASSWLLTDTSYIFDIVTLSNEGKPLDIQDLNVEVYKMDWSWWWSGNEEDRAGYVSTNTQNRVHQSTINTVSGKAGFRFRLNHPEWGSYLVKVKDPSGGHSTSTLVYFDWPDWYPRNNRNGGGGANLLTIAGDKEIYRPGEKATLKFPSPVNGKALISIENSSKQLRSYWVNTQAGETTLEVPVEDAYSPNVYVHIMVLQPHGKVENDLPVRLYGVIPLMVEDPQTRLLPVITMSDKLRPEQVYEVTISESSKHPMTYTLAVVDEGLLDLTNFTTPDPHASFYAKEALGLNTWDMYDFVLGAFGGRVEQVLSIGGDEAMMVRERARQLRFKPVVSFIGPFTLGAGQKQSHVLKMPNYLGAVRVMVIASSERAYGSSEKSVKVKQPLMILGTLPRVLRPEDEVVLPVSVFFNMSGKHEVEVKLSLSGSIQAIGNETNLVSFDGPGEKMTYFKLIVNEMPGMANVRIDAISGKEKSNYIAEIAVQNPNERMFLSQSFLVEAGKTMSSQLNMPVPVDQPLASIEISGLPSVSLDNRLRYLYTYPHGCTEQLASSGFAQLSLSDVISFDDDQKRNIDKHINLAILKIAQRQRSDGSVVYWPGSVSVNEWSDVFAGHFMLLASREGKSVPSVFMPLWQKNQRKLASTWFPENYNNHSINDQLQAYRLYVLALAGDPQLAAMNRLRENPGISQEAAISLAAAYAVSGQTSAARELVFGKTDRVSSSNQYRYSFGSALRDQALMLQTLMLLEQDDMAFRLLKDIAASLSCNEWLSTQSTAWGIQAWKLFATKLGKSESLSFRIEQNEKKTDVKDMKSAVYNQQLSVENNTVSITNHGKNPFYASVSTSGIPRKGSVINLEKGLRIETQFLDDNNKPLNVNALKQGTQIKVVTRVTNVSGRIIDHLALNQLIPAGWELVNSRLEKETNPVNHSFDFQDIRDDRILTYFRLDHNNTVAFTFTAIAAYEGKFQMPAMQCEDMYDREIMAVKGESVVEVIKNR